MNNVAQNGGKTITGAIRIVEYDLDSLKSSYRLKDASTTMLFHKTVQLSRPVMAAYCKVGQGKHTQIFHRNRRKTSMDEAKNTIIPYFFKWRRSSNPSFSLK